jgi:VWFA-related protein
MWSLVAALVLPVVPGIADEEGPVTLRPIGGLTFVDEIELTIANLVVYVTDKQGRAVTDLTKDDFEVYQDGDSKQITNFKLYTDEIIRSEYQEQSRIQPAETIDNENLEPLDRNRVLSQARDFVRSSLHPPARMMVVAYQRSFEVLQEFTSDPSQVLEAMRSVRTYTGGRTERIRASRDIMDRIKKIETDGRSSSSGSLKQGAGYEFKEVYAMIDNYAKETINDLQFSLDSLRLIITSLSGLEGKKGVIYVSNGLPMTPGMELYYELSRVTNDSSVIIRSFEHDRSRLYQQLAATANAQDVTFYAIDAAGLSMANLASAEYATASDPMSASVGRHNYSDSLRYLADETGGIAITDTNDVGPRLDLVAQDLYTYYSIGYPLQTSGQDKVHRVKVELRDDPAFSGYQLRYRSRFVEKSVSTRVQDAVMSSLVYEIDDNPIGIDVVTGTPAPASEKRWLLPTQVSFPINNIAMLPEGDDFVARVVLFVAARDADGKQSDLVRQEHEIRIPADRYEDAVSRLYFIDTQLLMEQGRYKISVALLDPLTRQDSYRTVSASVHPKK